MKKVLLLLCLALGLNLSAQEQKAPKTWEFKGVGGINMAQTSLTNWAAGGENSIAWNVYLNALLKYRKAGWTLENTLNTDFGQTYTTTNKWQKSVDKLNLTSKLGRNIANKLDITFLGDFLSQFTDGYKNATAQLNGADPVSTLFAPAYLTLASGLDYKPIENWSIFFSPLAGKVTMVFNEALSNQGAYGVKKGSRFFAELGTTLVTSYNHEIWDNINLLTKLTLFTAYTHDFGNIDVNWDVMLSAKINKYISATISTNLIYDDDVKIANEDGMLAPRVQFREMLGLGLSYKF